MIIINLEIWMLFSAQLLYITHNQEYNHWHGKPLQEDFYYFFFLLHTFNSQYRSVANMCLHACYLTSVLSGSLLPYRP